MSWLTPRAARGDHATCAHHKQVNYAAPVAFFDHPPDAEPLWPCPDCLPWHVEVLTDPDGTTRIRQWHAIGCPVWTDDQDDQGGGANGQAA